jgi:hypothetical protein
MREMLELGTGRAQTELGGRFVVHPGVFQLARHVVSGMAKKWSHPPHSVAVVSAVSSLMLAWRHGLALCVAGARTTAIS